MISKNILLLSIIFILIANISVVYADYVLLTPRMVLRIDEGESITEKIGLKNEENFVTSITLELIGDIKDITEIKGKEFILNPDEEKWIEFTITPSKSGEYYGEILSKFESKESQILTLSTQIVLIVNEKENNNNNLVYLAVPTIFLIIIFIFLIYYSKVTKKKMKVAKKKK